MCLSETKTLYTYADTIEWYESVSARWVVYSVYGNGNQGHTASLVPLGTDIADHALCLQVLKSFKVSPSLWFGRVQRGDTVFLSQDGYTVEHVISKEWLAQEQAQKQAAEEPINEATKEETMNHNANMIAMAVINDGATYADRKTLCKAWIFKTRSEHDVYLSYLAMCIKESKAPYYDGIKFTGEELKDAAQEVHEYMLRHYEESNNGADWQ